MYEMRGVVCVMKESGFLLLLVDLDLSSLLLV